MSNQNKDRFEEQQRVNEVLDVIEDKQTHLKRNSGSLKESIVTLRKDFWDDVTVNLDEPDDVIETQASLKQQAELLSERERSHGRMNDQLKTLDRLHDTPYFGRIDFLEEDERGIEPIYIGIASLMDEKEEDFLIYDWRAPISSMYYDYAPGPAEYDTIEGPIKGEISLKRQFIIKNGTIDGLFDTGLTIGDHLLQKMLGQHGSTTMKNIVATIQKEQNRIIRNEKSKLLIVQGVAGSGKTSAALQRVAYLLYAHRKTLTADNMLLFSPNPLFNSYVATVLPELGEENMKQTTYKDYVDERINGEYKVESPFEQMETFLAGKNDSVRQEAVHLKSSLDFKDLIDQYVFRLAEHGLTFQDVMFRGNKLIRAEKIKHYFYSLKTSVSLPNRLEQVSEWLLEQLAKLKLIEMRKPWVEEEIQLFDKEDYLEAFQEIQKDQDNDSFDDFEREQELLKERVVGQRFSPIEEEIKQLSFIHAKATYRQLFESRDFFKEEPSANWPEICKWTLNKLDQNELSWEDATPFLYLEDQLRGKSTYTNIQHVLIDEVQDYSPFQLSYLRGLFPRSRMTVLGDVNQAIHVHALDSPSILSEEKGETKNQERISLMRSYRSTRQIVDFTKQLVEGGDQIIPFNRDGNMPVVIHVENETALHQNISENLQEFLEHGHKTIAVLCKTIAESKKAYEQLKKQLPVQLMTQETYTFQKGILIMPAYLAKGIEFDAVILYNVSNTVYSRETERNLFYTACTRAMHDLHLFSIGEKSRFFDGVSSDTYLIRS